MRSLEDEWISDFPTLISFVFILRKKPQILQLHDLDMNDIDPENVDKVVNAFQNGKKYNILLAIQKKASASITLTACNHAIYYSNMWSFDERANSEARIYRKGSERHKHVFYTDLVVKDSVEEKVVSCLKRKKDLVGLLKKEFAGLIVGR